MAKTVKMKTRNLFLALASMMRSIMASPPQRLCTFSACGKVLECALNLRFGVDQEVCAGDYALAFLEPAFTS